MTELLEDEFSDLQAATEEALRGLWLNEADDVWDRYLSQAEN